MLVFFGHCVNKPYTVCEIPHIKHHLSTQLNAQSIIKVLLLILNTQTRAHTQQQSYWHWSNSEGARQHLVHRVNHTALGRRKARQPEKNWPAIPGAPHGRSQKRDRHWGRQYEKTRWVRWLWWHPSWRREAWCKPQRWWTRRKTPENRVNRVKVIREEPMLEDWG